ncbi:peroxiredoxin family protein [Gracilimonas sp. Q87]|uniref:peroxiredoxin family protein n=1 Tax=Gracilimonas sp. Q87 TaxID=3384766 RepID=UPI003983FE31
MRILILLFSLSLLFQTTAYSQQPKTGAWKGNIVYSNANIPFTFEVEYPRNSDGPVFTFINGNDRASLEASVQNDSIIIPMFAFDITLKMAMGKEQMTGTLIKHYSNRTYPFKAEYGKSRYEIKEEEKPVQVGSRWDMTVNAGRSGEYPAVGLFEQTGSRITGTILTEVSDYRFFEGKVQGDQIEMSVFDGVHAFLLKGTYDHTSEQWSGELILDDGYARPWIATPNENAELRDPFEVIDLTERNIRPDLEKLAALAEQRVTSEQYKGKVLIIQLMGTWCSNSQDQTRYLTEWLANHPDRNVETLAVNYEANYSVGYGLHRIEAYKRHLNIPYDMILGGPLSKTKAAEAFPFMDEILAFPTLIFIDKEGYARYVHSYFAGPATGSYYEDFDKRFNAIVDELTRE